MTVQILEDVINELHTDNQERDAYNSIIGYFYQFELTLLHILNGGTEDVFGDSSQLATYKVETIEDYVKYFEVGDQGYIRVAQIKHHPKGASNSKYYDAVLWLYYNYLKFVHKGIGNLFYKAIIFYHDPSEDKEIRTVLEEAFQSINQKIVKIRDKIIVTTLDSADNRESFSKIARFTKTESRKEITDKLKKKLNDRYGMITSYNEDDLYALAVSKLVQDGQNGIELSLQTLDAYFKSPTSKMDKFYVYKIIDEIFHLIDTNLADIENNPVISDDVIEDYRGIYDKIIKPFIDQKFQEYRFRHSFLHSIVPKRVREDKSPNTLNEYIAFVECSDAITQFFNKLAKIIYFHRLEKQETVDLDKWFEINDQGWLFLYPDETRGKGVITGDFQSRGVYACLKDLLPRLKHQELRPDVWYARHDDDEFNASKNMNYELDFVQTPRREIQNFMYCNPREDHFHIQCLQCLDATIFDRTSKIPNIFSDGCSIRRES